MRRKNDRIQRWRKSTALLLSAAMALSAAPGAVYAANEEIVAEEAAFNGEIVDDAVIPDNGGDISSESDGSNEPVIPDGSVSGGDEQHVHSWKGERISGNAVRIICSVSGSSCPVYPDGAILSLGMEEQDRVRAVVYADEKELASGNDLGISYDIIYFDDKGPLGSDAPQGDGSYKAIATCAGDRDLDLEFSYQIRHEHRWEYVLSKEKDTLGVVCRGGGNACVLPGKSADLILDVRKDSEDPDAPVEAFVSVNGSGPLNSGDFGIEEVKITYFSKEGGDWADEKEEAPRTDGRYRARATFLTYGGRTICRDKEFILHDGSISLHMHDWKYVLLPGADVISVNCDGAGTCKESEKGIYLSLDVVKRSDYTEASQESRVSISAKDRDGDPLDYKALNGLGISQDSLIYHKDAEGRPGDVLEDEPQDAGTYHVKAIFGGGDGAVLEEIFTIAKKVQPSDRAAMMESYIYGAANAAGPSLNETAGVRTITYHYYKGDAKDPFRSDAGSVRFDPKSLDAGTYHVSAEYVQEDNENYIYETAKTKFQVGKSGRSKIKVMMEDHDVKGKRPSPALDKKTEEDGAVVYYYNKQNKNTQGTKWSGKKLAKGTYYMYAVIKETTNYKKYTTPTKKFTVYPDHKWNGLPQKLTSKEQKKTIQCSYCGKKESVRLPQKTLNVAMGKSKKLVSKNTGLTFTPKVKGGYFSISSKQAKIVTKANAVYYRSMQTSIPVTVKAYGKTYTMTVKLEIPAPKVDIRYDRVRVGNVSGYQFKFHYNIPGADRIEVRMAKGETPAIRAYLDRYVSAPRPGTVPFINMSDSSLGGLGNKVTFRITAHYGRNKSQILTKTVSVR